jgi:hypothetical protein
LHEPALPLATVSTIDFRTAAFLYTRTLITSCVLFAKKKHCGAAFMASLLGSTLVRVAVTGCPKIVDSCVAVGSLQRAAATDLTPVRSGKDEGVDVAFAPRPTDVAEEPQLTAADRKMHASARCFIRERYRHDVGNAAFGKRLAGSQTPGVVAANCSVVSRRVNLA